MIKPNKKLTNPYSYGLISLKKYDKIIMNTMPRQFHNSVRNYILPLWQLLDNQTMEQDE
jgi:hypothetical protein